MKDSLINMYKPKQAFHLKVLTWQKKTSFLSVPSVAKSSKIPSGLMPCSLQSCFQNSKPTIRHFKLYNYLYDRYICCANCVYQRIGLQAYILMPKQFNHLKTTRKYLQGFKWPGKIFGVLFGVPIYKIKTNLGSFQGGKYMM